jgi:ATP-dependent RNA helicase DeaD
MTDNGEDSNAFSALGLDSSLVAALASLGYEEPTPVQREAIPILISGRDLVGQAATGTGKTAAFALPLLQRIASNPDRKSSKPFISALVLVPTRELAMQVAQAIHRYGRAMNASVLPIYGGQSIQQQLSALKRGVDVVVATPGRALDHIRRKTLDLGRVNTVILDEADEMLDMGFAEDLEAILESTPRERQTALFSATIAPRIRAIARRHLRDAAEVKIAGERLAAGEIPRVRQVAYLVQRQHKAAALGRVLDIESPTSALVFCRTRTEVDELTETLNGRGYRSEALHGGLSQEQRDRVMRRFRDGGVELLVATDVAARGLDIGHLSHVFNFDVPSSPDAYVHRIGRTGRAGREGVAITLAEGREHRLLRNIEQHTRQKIRVEALPTIHDLRSRRLELTRAALREAVEAGELDSYRVIVESLADDFELVDVAAAAVKLAHHATAGDAKEEVEIPTGRMAEAGAQNGPVRPKPRKRDAGREVSREGKPGGKRKTSRQHLESDVTKLYIGLGRRAGIRPADLVGAITNEAGIAGRTIGAIDIADLFSLVEVPEDSANEIISALKGATIRGQRVTVRRDHGKK